jgi:bifunctional DNA-binding transcriptional regulator/antitoxin component of YhaV-PrlF toxin-antitoxin module
VGEEVLRKLFTAYRVSDSLVVVIPRRARDLLGISSGQKFRVRVDASGRRLIYELAE